MFLHLKPGFVPCTAVINVPDIQNPKENTINLNNYLIAKLIEDFDICIILKNCILKGYRAVPKSGYLFSYSFSVFHHLHMMTTSKGCSSLFWSGG